MNYEREKDKSNVFLDLFSLFGILLFVLGSLILCFGLIPERYQLIHRLETEGLLAKAKIESEDETGFLLYFQDSEQQERSGRLYKKHYRPSQIDKIREKDQFDIRYLARASDGQALLLEEGLDSLLYDLYFFRTLLILLFISWIFIILQPDFLFIGIEQELQKIELPPLD